MGGANFIDVPRFDGSNYVYWSKIMSAYLVSLGYNIWKILNDEYKEPTNGPTSDDEK